MKKIAMKKYTTFAALLLLCTLTASAQIPGYMGKKLVVTYDLSASPAMSGPNAKNRVMFDGRAQQYNMEKRFLSFNWQHGITADYVTGRRTSVGGGMSFYNTMVLFNTNVEDTTITWGSLQHNNVYPADSTGAVSRGDVKTIGFSFYVKKFRSKYIAPMGGYRKFELFGLAATTTYRLRDFDSGYNYYYSSSNGIANVGAGKDHHTYFGVAYTAGKQRIISDNVVIDFAVRFAYIFGTINTGAGQGLSFDSPYNETNYIRTMTLHRLAKNEWFNFKVGLGFLN